MADFKHGLGGYNNHNCRCSICTKANTEYHAKRRESMSPEQRRHAKQVRIAWLRKRAEQKAKIGRRIQ